MNLGQSIEHYERKILMKKYAEISTGNHSRPFSDCAK